MTKRMYEVQGRNGYYGIDEYIGTDMQRNIDCVKGRKNAEGYADSLRQAYADGRKDALCGFTLPLLRDVESYQRPTLTAGTLVEVISRRGAWFKIKAADGTESECQYCDLRNDE